jgi:hypothetical protein
MPPNNTRDEVLKRLLKMPPKPHADEKHPRVKKAKLSRVKTPKSKTGADIAR